MFTLSRPFIVLLSLFVLITTFSCESENTAKQEAKYMSSFVERSEYLREAKVVSAEHQVYPKEICVEASDTVNGEGFASLMDAWQCARGGTFLDHGDCDDVRTMGTNGHISITAPESADRYLDPICSRSRLGT